MTDSKKTDFRLVGGLPLWLCVAPLVISLVALAIAAILAFVSIAETLGTDETDGNVVGMDRRVEKRRAIVEIRPVAEYMVDGEKYECHAGWWETESAYKVGDHVPVRYKRKQPGRSVINTFGQRWVPSLIPAIIGAFFGMMGGGLMAIRIRTSRANVPSAGTAGAARAEKKRGSAG
jgi:hypothetical protein